MTVWIKYTQQCKSRLSTIGRCLFQGRKRWKKCAQQRLKDLQDQKKENQALQNDKERLQKALENSQKECEKLRNDLQRLHSSTAIQLPHDPPLAHHQFGPRMIELSINLARSVGLRAAIRVMTEFFTWLKVEVKLPTWQSVRIWMQRLGIARLERHSSQKKRIWLVDHSNQIGQEKVLLILGIAPKDLPAPGKTLRQSDMDTLACIPGVRWKREDVARIYTEVAKKYGDPRAILTDGAVELRESIELAHWQGKKPPLALRDLKHFLSNRLEWLLKKDHDFEGYISEIGKTRCVIQQTELSYLTPPCIKNKARFMNLQSMLQWGKMVCWYLKEENHLADGVDQDRLESKLGWIRRFEKSIERWNAYQRVISTSLTWMNENGIHRGSVKELAKLLKSLPDIALSRPLMKETLVFLKEQIKNLRSDERLWLSTEVIESVFGSYKQFEGQHSKGGFTTLLPSLSSLLKRVSAREIVKSFRRVSIKQLKLWLAKHLPQTNHAKRRKVAKKYRTWVLNHQSPHATKRCAIV